MAFYLLVARQLAKICWEEMEWNASQGTEPITNQWPHNIKRKLPIENFHMNFPLNLYRNSLFSKNTRGNTQFYLYKFPSRGETSHILCRRKKITISSLKIFSLEQWIRSVYIKYRRLNGWDFWFHVSDLLAPELEKNVPQINKFRWVSGKDITFY